MPSIVDRRRRRDIRNSSQLAREETGLRAIEISTSAGREASTSNASSALIRFPAINSCCSITSARKPAGMTSTTLSLRSSLASKRHEDSGETSDSWFPDAISSRNDSSDPSALTSLNLCPSRFKCCRYGKCSGTLSTRRNTPSVFSQFKSSSVSVFTPLLVSSRLPSCCRLHILSEITGIVRGTFVGTSIANVLENVWDLGQRSQVDSSQEPAQFFHAGGGTCVGRELGGGAGRRGRRRARLEPPAKFAARARSVDGARSGGTGRTCSTLGQHASSSAAPTPPRCHGSKVLEWLSEVMEEDEVDVLKDVMNERKGVGRRGLAVLQR